MKNILLSKGKFALVDDEDFEYVNQWKWSLSGNNYAKRLSKGKTILLHRVIMNPPDNMEIDHINGNGLDNRRSNLRICNHSENTSNRGLNSNSSTGKIGIYSCGNKYRAAMKVGYKTIHIGYFDNIGDAVRARNDAAKIYRGNYARLNKDERPDTEQSNT